MLYILKGKEGIDLALLDSDAKVVLIGDGVYLDVSGLKGKVKLYALKESVEKRGLSLEGVEFIDYGGLVDMIDGDRVVNL